MFPILDQLQAPNLTLWTSSNLTCFHNTPYFAQSDLLRECFFQILPQANSLASKCNLWTELIIHTAPENYFLNKPTSPSQTSTWLIRWEKTHSISDLQTSCMHTQLCHFLFAARANNLRVKNQACTQKPEEQHRQIETKHNSTLGKTKILLIVLSTDNCCQEKLGTPHPCVKDQAGWSWVTWPGGQHLCPWREVGMRGAAGQIDAACNPS